MLPATKNFVIKKKKRKEKQDQNTRLKNERKYLPCVQTTGIDIQNTKN